MDHNIRQKEEFMPVKNKKLNAKKQPMRATPVKKAPAKKKLPVKAAKKLVKKKPPAKKPPVKKKLVISKQKNVKKVTLSSPKKNKKAPSLTKKTLSKVVKASKAAPKKTVVKKKTVKKPIKTTLKKVIELTKPMVPSPKKGAAPVKSATVQKAAPAKPTGAAAKGGALQAAAIKPGIVPAKNSASPSPAAANPSIMKPLANPVVAKKVPAKKPGAGQVIPKSTKRPGAGPAGFLPYEARTGEDYMSEAQLTHFQHVLHLWKEQLYADRNATTQHMRDDTINFPDPLDRAALEEEHTLEWRAREREHRLIIKIDQALSTIKQGDYGYCEACGAEIGIRRLEARPTATQCIDCKTIDEIRERHAGILE